MPPGCGSSIGAVEAVMTTRQRIVSGAPYEHGSSMQLPRWLSDDHVKRFRYSQEAYVQEAVAALEHHGVMRPEALCRYCALLLKPDCHPTRSAMRVVAALNELGFIVHHAELIQLTRHSLREMWRFELNRSLPARYSLWDLAFLGQTFILMVLRTEQPDLESSLALARMKSNIRGFAGAQKGILNRLHVPDSLIDCLRELSILIPADRLARMLAAPSVWPLHAVDALVREPMQAHAQRSLELETVLETHSGVSAFVAENAEVIESRPLDLQLELVRRFSLDHWDLVVLFNEFARVIDSKIPRALDFETHEFYRYELQEG